MNVKTVLGIVSRHNVKTAVDALDAGLPLQLLGSGAYRKVYDIVGTRLIIKFPNPEYLKEAECIKHSIKEYEAVCKVMSSKDKRYSSIRKHMPKIHFCNPITGVLVANRYQLLAVGRAEDRRLLSLKIKSITSPQNILDVNNCGNVGVDGRGTLKVIDAGYILGI